MKIRVFSPKDDQKKAFRLYLPIPLGILKWRVIWKYAPEETKPYLEFANVLVDAMKEYKRANGGWDLVDISTSDGTKVNIRI